MMCILSSGPGLSVPASSITLTQSETSATDPVGSMARLTGGPTSEFLSGRLATIFGPSGLARSTISTESLPGDDRICLPLEYHSSFSSLPAIRNGAGCSGHAPARAWIADHPRLIESEGVKYYAPLVF